MTRIPARLKYTPVELCVGLVMGDDPWAPALPPSQDPSPRAAMEETALVALKRPPCFVSFSGGRDSSAVLAMATSVARREGLPPPVPATNRFPGVDGADESRWQEQVVRHLGLKDWERLDWADELDLLGPVADDVFQRHGFSFPHNLHFHDPLMALARGGSLLTGVGGDEIVGFWPRANARNLVFGDRREVTMRRARRAGIELLPRAVRLRRARRQPELEQLDWLKDQTKVEIGRLRAETSTARSLRWGDELERWWRQRFVQCALAALRALGSDHDVAVFSPFIEGRVCAAWRAFAGPAGPPSRSEALRLLVGDTLPEEVISRRSKAEFTSAFFSTHCRAFVQRWTGAGVDPAMVSIERLRSEWTRTDSAPHPSTHALLRQARYAS